MASWWCEDGVGTALSSDGAAWGRCGSGLKVAWELRGGGVRAALARVATVWGRRGGGVEAVMGQCEDDLGLMQAIARAASEVRVEGCILDVLGFVLVDALVFVLIDELGFILIDALVVVLVQVLGYVVVEALLCVPVEQHFKQIMYTSLERNELREPVESGGIMR